MFQLARAGGLGLSLAAVLAFAADHVVPGAIASVIAMAALALAESRAPVLDAPSPRPRAEVGIVLVVLALAAVFRLYRLDEIPWGLNNDVAWNAFYALRILKGEPYTPYTDEAWGKETFFFYLIAGCFRLIGVSERTLLLPAVAAGTLTVGAFYLASRELFDRRGAVAGSLLLSAMAWHLTLSRTGYRAILAPLCLLLLLWCFFRAVDAETGRARLAWFAAAGIALGVGHHSYFSFRVATPLLAVLAVREAWVGRGFWRRNAAGLGVMLACTAILVAPLAVYAVRNPEIFFARTGHLWIGHRIREAGSWTPFWENLRDNLLMFHHRARVGNFFNSEWPILSRSLGVLFLAGFGVLIGGARRRAPFVALVVAVLAHLPAILSGADATRSLMFTIAVAWAAAAGLEAALALLPAERRNAVAALAVAGVMAAELHFYFLRLGRDPAAQYGYAGLHMAVGRTVAELAKDHVTFVSPGHNFETTWFLWRDLPPERIVGRAVEAPELLTPEQHVASIEQALSVPRPPGLGLAFVVEDHPANEPAVQRILATFPGAVRREFFDARFGRVTHFSFVVPGGGQP